jgi:predicted ATP-binding protein involved in virulence
VVTQVKELQLRSFRGIDRLDLKFHPKVSVFLGVNGVGKSTILDALSILFSRIVALSQIPYQVAWKDNDVLRRNFQGSMLNSLYAQKQENPKVRRVIDIDLSNNSESSSISLKFLFNSHNLEWSYQRIRNLPIQVIPDEWDQLGNFVANLQANLLENPRLNIPLIAYYSTHRVVTDIPLEIPVNPYMSQLDSYDGISGTTNAGFPEFFRWFRVVEDLENESRRDRSNYRDQQLSAVRKALPNFLEGFLDLRVRRSPTLRMTVTKGDRELLVNQLSDGEKCLLAMVGDIARRLSIANPGLDDPLQGEGVILIDELELHLHPKWQRGIIPKLTETFPNCQFIVATHSPQIISDVQPESIFILKSTDFGVIVEHPAHSFGRDSNQILEDLMGVSDRPEAIKTKLQDLFELIENGELDQAKQVKNNLEHLMGLDEPEFAKADVLIRRREILGR